MKKFRFLAFMAFSAMAVMACSSDDDGGDSDSNCTTCTVQGESAEVCENEDGTAEIDGQDTQFSYDDIVASCE